MTKVSSSYRAETNEQKKERRYDMRMDGRTQDRPT